MPFIKLFKNRKTILLLIPVVVVAIAVVSLLTIRKLQLRSNQIITDTSNFSNTSPTQYLFNQPLENLNDSDIYIWDCFIKDFERKTEKISDSLTATYFIRCSYVDAQGKNQAISFPVAFTRKITPNSGKNYANHIFGINKISDTSGQLPATYIERQLFEKLKLSKGSKITIGVGLPSDKNKNTVARKFLEPEFSNHKQTNINRFIKTGNPKYLDQPILLITAMMKQTP